MEMTCEAVLGSEFAGAARAAREFLVSRTEGELLGLVGEKVAGLGLRRPGHDKRAFPASYGGGKPCGGDLLAGAGMFYVTEEGRVMLDCTSGHYQMTWGYNPPELVRLMEDATRVGVVWDNHSNIPSQPVKQLADEMTGLAGEAGLDRALLGVCTGSVACSTALKIMLARYAKDAGRVKLGKPAIITLAGNYHGTDMVAQWLRGMWPGLVGGVEAVSVEPNDMSGLEAAFASRGRRVAGFWAEPIMMNREAIAVSREFLLRAQGLCRENDALTAIDEIQTCCWYPETLMSMRLGLEPDMLVVGKGMTAGFHPLAGLLYRRELDILEQYDSISTNGNASLAAVVALGNLRLIAASRERMERLARMHYEGLVSLAEEFGDVAQGVNGEGFLSGLKFRRREDALGFHRAALERGLWVRAHAYHEGHSAVLSKHALVVTEEIEGFVLGVCRELLRGRGWR